MKELGGCFFQRMFGGGGYGSCFWGFWYWKMKEELELFCWVLRDILEFSGRSYK